MRSSITEQDVVVGKVYRVQLSDVDFMDLTVERIADGVVHVRKSSGKKQTFTIEEFIAFYNYYGVGMQDADEEK